MSGTKLNKAHADSVKSIDAKLKEALAANLRLHKELTLPTGMVWNPTFKKALQADRIVIQQMRRMNATIETLKKEMKA